MQTDGHDKGQSVKEIVAEEKERLDLFIEHAKEYTEARLDLISITVQEKVSDVASSLVLAITLGIIGIISFLFLSAGLAWWIGGQLNSPSAGFFSIAGLHLVLGVLVYLVRDRLIKTPVVNFLMRKININEED